MRLRPALMLLCLLPAASFVALPASAAPPENDGFPGLEVTTLPFHSEVDTAEATREKIEPAGCGGSQRTVWFSFTPAADVPLVAYAVSASSGSAIVVYTGSGLSTLTSVTCNPTYSAGQRARVPFSAVAGTTYYIQVGPYASGSGMIVFDLVAPSPPANDDFDEAQSVGGVPYHHSVAETGGGSLEEGEPVPDCAPTPFGPSVWYRFRPAMDTTALLYVRDSSFLAVVAVYTGTEFGDLTQVNCIGLHPLKMGFEQGVTYHIQVSGYRGAGGALEFETSPPLPNDDLADATAVTAFPSAFDIDLRRATTQEGEPLKCTYNTMTTAWYRISAVDAMIKVALTGQYYPVVAAYSQEEDGINPLGCAYSFSTTANLSFEADPDKTYLVQLGSLSTPSLVGSVDFTLIPPPPNDQISSAAGLSSVPSFHEADTSGSTTDPSDPIPTCANSSGTIWYRYTATGDRRLVVDTIGAKFDTVLAVFSGSGPDDLVELGCNDDFNSLQSRVIFEARDGTTYFLQVAGFKGARGLNRLNIDIDPLNDQFEDAELVTSPLFVDEMVTSRATEQQYEPRPGCNADLTVKTVWYRMTAETPGTITADTFGSSFDTVLAIYEGPPNSSIDQLTPLTCSEDVVQGRVRESLTFTAIEGKTYYFQVGGWWNGQTSLEPSSHGTMRLRIVRIPAL